MAVQKRSIAWIDVGGRTRQTIPFCDPDCGALMAALQNHSEATVLEYFEGPVVSLSGTAAGAQYADVAITARLVFQDATGHEAAVSLPSPDVSIFLPDQVTVDPSAITDFLTAAIGHLATSAGTLVTTYKAGTLQGRTSGG